MSSRTSLYFSDEKSTTVEKRQIYNDETLFLLPGKPLNAHMLKDLKNVDVYKVWRFVRL